jgi:D-sedoheptulose 7-phosphate isomerase
VNRDALKTLVRDRFLESSRILAAVGEEHADVIVEAATLVEESLRQGGVFFTCGNGGSAADAQHIAAELSGRFYLERPGLPAEALTVNTSALTAIANDYDYERVFSRQLEGRGKAGDVLLAITTSGKSPSVVKAVESARALEMTVIGFTGALGASFAARCDAALVVPSEDVARIQECHITAGHLLCQLVEALRFGGGPR